VEKGKNSREETLSSIQSHPINAELSKHEQMLKQELSKALNQEESFAKQKSRVQWLGFEYKILPCFLLFPLCKKDYNQTAFSLFSFQCH
jgi:hypothetical protein